MLVKLFYVILLIIACKLIGLMCQINLEYEHSTCGEGTNKGICKPALECPTAEKALRQRRPHGLERCGFEGFIEVVCCKDFIDKKPITKNPTMTRRSEIACKEYSNEVPPDPTFQILGGENASLGEFPHMAALGYEDPDSDDIIWECGGSLISNHYVITAAHCVFKQDGSSPVRVRLGIIDLKGHDKIVPMDFGVRNISVHKQYQRRSKTNDLALIQLEGAVVSNNHVHPACLYHKNDDPLGLVVTGWGYTDAGGDPSNILQKAQLRPVPVTECTAVYESRLSRSISSLQICAVSDDGTRDTCQGDSGGPLQVQQEEGSSIYSIVGVTSYGMGCGGKTPGIYTRVSSYLDWIESIVWP